MQNNQTYLGNMRPSNGCGISDRCYKLQKAEWHIREDGEGRGMEYLSIRNSNLKFLIQSAEKARNKTNKSNTQKEKTRQKSLIPQDQGVSIISFCLKNRQNIDEMLQRVVRIRSREKLMGIFDFGFRGPFCSCTKQLSRRRRVRRKLCIGFTLCCWGESLLNTPPKRSFYSLPNRSRSSRRLDWRNAWVLIWMQKIT
jgi:hypothetical protein